MKFFLQHLRIRIRLIFSTCAAALLFIFTRHARHGVNGDRLVPVLLLAEVEVNHEAGNA